MVSSKLLARNSSGGAESTLTTPRWDDETGLEDGRPDEILVEIQSVHRHRVPYTPAVAESIAGRPGHVDYGVIPSVVYTMPELASVGRTSEQLKEAGVAFRTASFPFLANSRARANRETDGTVTILATEGDGVILGAHIVGPNAGEMIGEVCVAMTLGATAEDLARTCHAHPTLSEGLRQAAMGIDGWTMQA